MNKQKTKRKPKQKKIGMELETIKPDSLTMGQELFCQYYASDKEFFGNGVRSYAAAYNFDLTDIKQYNVAKSLAGRMLTNVDILRRIDQLLDLYINDQTVDKELGFTIVQKADLSSKVAAIREYNRIKRRVDDSTKIFMPTQINVYETNGKSKNTKSRSSGRGAISQADESLEVPEE